MGGATCKQLCKRASESGDALDDAKASLGLLPQVSEASCSSSGPSQVGIDRTEDFQAAQRATAALDSAPGHERSAAWKACEQAWSRALRPKKVEDDKKISDLIASAGPGWFSFEFFPPKTDEGVRNLRSRIQRMKGLGPLFLDFTWGAGGSTSDLTLMLTSEAKNQMGCVTNMHLTCTNQKGDMVSEAIASCQAVGVCNIVALRGDPPRGQEKWKATEGGFSCAQDLVRFIREKHGSHFCISVAGYPEGHPDSIEEVPGGFVALSASEKRRARVAKDKSGKQIVTVCRDAQFQKELEYLKQKVDAGADFIITQVFLDHQVYLDFVDRCRECDIKVPIVPGIMMLNSFGGFSRMTSLCKTRLPDGFLLKAEASNTNDDTFKEFVVEFATSMCRALLAGGAPGLHFYTLNLEKVVVRTLKALELISEEQAQRCLAGDSDAKAMVSAQGITCSKVL